MGAVGLTRELGRISARHLPTVWTISTATKRRRGLTLGLSLAQEEALQQVLGLLVGLSTAMGLLLDPTTTTARTDLALAALAVPQSPAQPLDLSWGLLLGQKRVLTPLLDLSLAQPLLGLVANLVQAPNVALLLGLLVLDLAPALIMVL